METQTTTSDWPGAFGLYHTAKQVTKVNVWTIVKLYALSLLVSLALSLMFGRNMEWLTQTINLLAGSFITTAITLVYLKATEKKHIGAWAAIEAIESRFIDMFFLLMLTYLLWIVSFVLLVVPFFFVAPRLALAPYFLLDKELNAVDALKASWEASRGNVGKVYGIFGVNVVYCLLFLTIIGIPFAIFFFIMYSSALAVLYRQVIGKPLAYNTKL